MIVIPAAAGPGNAYGHCKDNGNGHPNQQPARCSTSGLAFVYTYDSRGLVTERRVVSDQATTVTAYSHDGLGRLTGSVSGEVTATYAWDAASNLVGETVSDDLSTALADDGWAITRVVNAADQTTSIVRDPYHLPAEHTTTTTFGFDARANRVTGVHDSGANLNQAKDDVVTTWARDGLGRPLEVTEDGTVRDRVYDGFDLVVDGGTRVTNGPGGVLSEAHDEQVGNGSKATTVTVTFDVLADMLGTPMAVAAVGQVDADLAWFDDFGQPLRDPGDWATVTGYTGHPTAGGLVETVTRAYDPATRVWVQEDTWSGQVTVSASTNRYTYVQGAPETYVDTLGLARGDAAVIASLGLSAAETAWLLAVAAQYRATPACSDTYHCYLQGVASSTTIPTGGPPDQVASWWMTLPGTTQSSLITLYPEVIGNLDGLPMAARDRANRIVLRQTVGSVENTLGRLGARQWDLMAEMARAALRGSESDYMRAERELNRVRQQIDTYNEQLAMLQAVHDQVRSSNRQLMLLDTQMPGRAAIAIGNVDTADHIGILVPGMTSSVTNKVAGLTEDARQLRTLAAQFAEPRGETVATVAWIGYEAPMSLGEAMKSDHAQRGAPQLASTLWGIQHSRLASGSDPHLTLIGHSYGSVVGGLVAQEDNPIDDLVAVGSPGFAEHVSELQIPSGHVFVGKATSDMLVAQTGHHGARPHSEDFGATVFEVGGGPHPLADGDTLRSHGHSEYFMPGSESLYNMVAVLLGEYGSMTLHR